MLTLTSLNTHYGQAHILRDVSLSLGEGEIVSLLGRNGAGKSTTMKAVIGMVAASGGAVMFDHKNLLPLKNYERARLGIGYVPEERRIFRELTVLENIETGMRVRAYNQLEPWTIARIYGLFPKLEELKDRLGGQLSGGEQQMLTVARTLMTNPRCLLLDEPTEGLAPVIVQTLMSAIAELKKQGLSILLSEQNKHISSSLADKVYVLEKGALIFEGRFADMTPQALQAVGW
ncbi:MAG: ABC transporter ATP-binding protein [Alphaproteobacteria bacterium]|nr:ABC transporter ATP-binding protein [Alphaproteobacteria bacterium]